MSSIPSGIRAPGTFISFKPGASKAPTRSLKILVVGHQNSDKSNMDHRPESVRNNAHASELYGPGSILAQTIEAVRKNNPLNEIYGMTLAEPNGEYATCTVRLVGDSAEESGVLTFYIAGIAINVAVAKGEKPTTVEPNTKGIVERIFDEIKRLESRIPCVAVLNADKDTITLTARHKGKIGNIIDIRYEYYGTERPVKGLEISDNDFNGGTLFPDASNMFSVAGGIQWDFIVFPWADSTTIKPVRDELNKRWGPLYLNDGRLVTASTGDYNALTSVTATQNNEINSPHVVVVEASKSPTSPWVVAGAAVGAITSSAQNNPAVPFRNTELVGVLPAKAEDGLSFQSRNQLLFKGIATTKNGFGGKLLLERVITTYVKNDAGHDDTSYLDLNTLLTLSQMRTNIHSYFDTKYAKSILMDEDSADELDPGISFLTPKLAENDSVLLFKGFRSKGWVQNLSYFEDNIKAVISDDGRMDIYWNTPLTQGLKVLGFDVSFLFKTEEG